MEPDNLFKTYRPAPSAHSTHLHIRPDLNTSLPFAPVSKAKFRKEHRLANDTAALDRLLATEFQSPGASSSNGPAEHPGLILAKDPARAVSHTRSSKSGAGGAGAGKLARNLSEKIAEVVRPRDYPLSPPDASSGPRTSSHRRPSQNTSLPHHTSQSHHNNPSQHPHHHTRQSRPTSPSIQPHTLGVYIDQNGRLHDKEYDPFEKVRSLSRRKVERSKVFGGGGGFGAGGGSRGGSEVGSLGSEGSGGGGGWGSRDRDREREREREREMYREYERTISKQGPSAWNPPTTTIPITSGYKNEGFQVISRPTPSSNPPLLDQTSAKPDPGSKRERSGTIFSEYDSGVSASYLSPRLGPRRRGAGEGAGGDGDGVQGEGEHEHDDASEDEDGETEEGEDEFDQQEKRINGVISPSTTRSSPYYGHAQAQAQAQGHGQGYGTSHQTFQTHLTSHTSHSHPHSTHTHTQTRTQLEERPRSLLYPATPAQIAAQRIRERREKDAAGGKSLLRSDILDGGEVLRPPIAPFSGESGFRRGSLDSFGQKTGKHAQGARRPMSFDNPQSRRPSSTTHYNDHPHSHYPGQSGGQGSSVFSGADMGYLPTRWARGEREFREGEEELERYRPMEFRGTRDEKDPEWKPGFGDTIKRNWQEISLALRFSGHRAKKKVERKVRNM